MRTLHFIKRVYGFGPYEAIPSPLKHAYETATRMERATKLFPMAPFWDTSYCKLKAAGKKKRQQTHVRFGEVKLYHSPQLDKTDVVSTETAPISDKIDREIASRQILEKCVLPLLSQGGSLRFSSSWIYASGGTPEDLQNRLVSNKITLEQLIKDLQYIMTYFEKNHIAILGYRSAWKLLPTYEDMICRRISASSTQTAWFRTGKQFRFLPKIRLYLIKVCRDPITAARHMQQTWRKWKKREAS